MSLMRINYVRNEMKKLSLLIEDLIRNYDRDLKEYDSDYTQVKEELDLKLKRSEGTEEFYDNVQEQIEYEKPINDIKTFSQFQNELILVKHVALIENMIINLFEHLVYIHKTKEYKEKYFDDKEHFTDIFIAIKKIAEITEKKVNIKKIKFWKYYETMRCIRHSIAHGDILFELSYRRLKNFNEEINLIHPYGEIEDDEFSKKFSPTKLHPTFDNKSTWYCHLVDNINSLGILNEKCLGFIEEIRESYLSYGDESQIDIHTLYARTRF
ncbi:hypothetical protein [Arcobacter sp. YIC-310]|uniref:hypothetical protein n=1 Tax=Arcobacter sp. YIC-310 TaxID=3376632 RepID=UPI003C2810D9